MSKLFLLGLFAASSVFMNGIVAHAVSNLTYSCDAKSNPDRGFPVDFTAEISVDKTLSLKTPSGEKTLGKVDYLKMSISDVGGPEVIGSILQYVGSVELSGVKNPAAVDSMERFSLEDADI